MNILNVEIKARCANPDHIRTVLKNKGADYKGTDHQVDTYFNVKEGRLKLREGTIENNLIYYRRADTAGPKPSDISLVPADPSSDLKDLLVHALGVKAVVDKHRKIYFINNVKFHIDQVVKLGTFVEIEAIDKTGNIGAERLHQQCRHYLSLFGIEEEDLVSVSYADLITAGNK